MALALVDQTPSLGKEYEDQSGEQKNTSEILAKKRRWFRAYEANKRDEIQEQQQADRYYHSKQWTDDEVAKLKRRGQPVITSNRVKRKIDFLVGVEQRMRRDPKAFARNPQDTQTADTATAGLRFVCDNNNWESIASCATSDGMRRGVGVCFVGIKPKGEGYEVTVKDVEADRFFYDPRSTRPDFSDARFMGVSLWLDIDEAKEEWPEADFDRYMDKDGGLSTFATEEDRAEQWGDFENRRVRVVEMWTKGREGWEYCKFCGDLYLEGGESPYIDAEGESDCPYVAWSPYIDEKGVRYGLVRDMKTIQDEVNHRRSKALHEINQRQIFLREGAVDDVDKLREEAAKTDGLIIHNGVWGEDIGFVDRTKELRGNLEMLVEAKQEIENLGPNPGLIGKGEGVQAASGRALLTQRDSGMTELQPVFDHNRHWKLRVYRKIWARIKQAWTGERWIRITDNPDAPKYIGVNQYEMDPMTGQIQGQNVIGEIDVDIILDEGPDTITVQEELFQTLAQLGEAAAGPIGMALIQLSNVANKERIIELLQPQPDPAQQQIQEQTMRGNEAKITAEEAKAQESQARAAKTMAEIEGQAMRLPADVENLQANTVKTMTDAYMAELNAMQPANQQ